MQVVQSRICTNPDLNVMAIYGFCMPVNPGLLLIGFQLNNLGQMINFGLRRFLTNAAHPMPDLFSQA